MKALIVLLLAATISSSAPSGQRDFDFLLGHWTLQNHRLAHILAGSHQWISFGGVSHAYTIWNGRAVLEEVRFDMPGHPIDGLSLHFYAADKRQWSQYWATAATGLSSVPNVGSFSNGVGTLIDHETFNGKPVLTRYRWTHTANTAHWEQAFSPDNGRTWETNWTTDYKRT